MRGGGRAGPLPLLIALVVLSSTTPIVIVAGTGTGSKTALSTDHPDRLCDKPDEKECRESCFEKRNCKTERCRSGCRSKCCEYGKGTSNVFAHRYEVDGDVRWCDSNDEKACRNKCLNGKGCSAKDGACQKKCRKKCCQGKRKQRDDEHGDDRRESKKHDSDDDEDDYDDDHRICNTEEEKECYRPCRDRKKCGDDKVCRFKCKKKCCKYEHIASNTTNATTSGDRKSDKRLCDREKEKECRDLCIETKDCRAKADEEGCIKPCRESCCRDEYDDERLCNTMDERMCRERCFKNRDCKGDGKCERKCRLKCCEPGNNGDDEDEEKPDGTAPTPAPKPGADTKAGTETFAPTSGTETLCDGITRKQRSRVTLMRLSLISDVDDLTSLDTPQGRALRWILAEDDAELCPLDEALGQRYVLAVLYFATNGDGWTDCGRDDGGCSSSDSFGGKEAFLSGGTECNWAGVSCNSRVKVRNLQLANNNLEGTVPAELQSLGSLDILGLENNSLSGPVPARLNDGLIRLRLNNNKLDGPAPATLPISLIALYLNDNVLDGKLDNLIGSLPNMRQLQLQNNLFTGTIPASLKEMTNLRIALFSGNDLTGSMPQEVCDAMDPNLSTLEVDCDEVSCDCCDPECTQ